MNRTTLFLIGIVLLGAVLRFWHLDYGQPEQYLPDEEFFLEPAKLIAEGDLDPQWYGVPAQPLLYLLAFVMRVVNFMVNGGMEAPVPVALQPAEVQSMFVLAGRMLTAAFGTGIVVLLYFLGKQWSTIVGLLAALLGAISAPLVEHSHVIRPDIIQSFFLLCALLALIHVLRSPKRGRAYVLLGVFFGLAIISKWPSVFFLIPIGYAAVVLARQQAYRWRYWFSAAGATLLTMLLFAPYVFLNFGETQADVSGENRAVHAGHDSLGFLGNLWYYMSDALSWMLGSGIALLVLGTIIGYLAYWVRRHALSERKHILALFVVAAISYLLLVSLPNLHWDRWMIPVVALSLLVAAVGLEFLWKRYSGKPIIFLLIVAILCAAPVGRLIRTVNSFAVPHTFELARDWIREHVPTGSKFAVEDITPELPEGYTSAVTVPNLSWKLPHEYRDAGVTHLLVSSSIHDVIRWEADRDIPLRGDYQKAVLRYDQLFAQSTFVHAIRPHPTYTADQLIRGHDWQIFSAPNLVVHRGPILSVYAFTDI